MPKFHPLLSTSIAVILPFFSQSFLQSKITIQNHVSSSISNPAIRNPSSPRIYLTEKETAGCDEIRKVDGLQDGMKMRFLPGTNLLVSELCLGSLTFGDQLNKGAAFSLLDAATKEYGINFIDTAESFPWPSAQSTLGRSELIIGEWLKGQGKSQRDKVVISTKICGFSDQMTWCREDGQGTRINRKQVIEAVDAQLKRLGTDYIDLLQFHWPDRYVPLYGAPDYFASLERSTDGEDAATPIREQLEIVQELVKSGKIRHFGLSNETPYGLTSFLTTASLLNLPRPCTVQNSYNLLERNDFETGLLETCSKANGNVGLLAYSPLAGGALTGKYLEGSNLLGKSDRSARMRQFVGFMNRYISKSSTDAIREYLLIADSLSLPLAPLALAWVFSRPFVTSTIIGATNLDQLRDNVLSLNLPISPEVATMINDVYKRHMDPTKGVFPVVDPFFDYVDPAKLPWGAKDQDVDPELDILINQRISKF